jgi:N4-gp56 family major capsid protein
MPTVTGATNPELFPLYYEKKLLEYVKENLVALKYGQKRSLPPHSGRQVTFTRFEPLPPKTTPITFQPTPSEGKSISTQQITATVEEYGDYIDLDEFTDMTSFVPLVDEIVDLLGYQAELSLDTIAMQELTNGTNVLYAGGVSAREELDGTKKITKADIRKAVNLLKRKRIPPFPDGYYVCFIHPDKTLDLFTEQELLTLAMANKDYLEKGEIGKFAGVKFVETTVLPVIEQTVGESTVEVYQTLVFGQNAYGVVDIDGNTIKMEMTNLDKLGRVKTLGWKAYFTCKRLYEPAIVRIESN